MYEIILDVFAYMMRFCRCVFLFPRKRKRREVTWCSDFVSNSPQAPAADSISADMIACVASVSSRGSSRKLGQEQKKK